MKMQLKNVRLSFPAIWKKAVFDGAETKFEATFLLNKESQADQISAIEKAIDVFLTEKFGGKDKVPKSLKRTCFMDGDEKDYEGYAGHMAFKGSSTKRITVIDRDRTPLGEDDGKPEAGDYVNAIVDFWYSDHPKGGKQLLGNVLGIQFVKQGERFGSSGASPDDFDVIEDDEMFS